MGDDNVTVNPIEDMAEDAARSMFPTVEVDNDDVNVEEELNIGTKKIYNLLDVAKKLLWVAIKTAPNYK